MALIEDYTKDSLVLESVWETRTGVVKVIDFMPPRGEAPDVVRFVEGLSCSDLHSAAQGWGSLFQLLST